MPTLKEKDLKSNPGTRRPANLPSNPSKRMCNYEKIVHTCGHVQPDNIWYCSGAHNYRADIYARCCPHTFPNSHYIIGTSDTLCYRCNRLHLRAQEHWQRWKSPICFTSNGRYIVLPSRLGPWGHMGVWLRSHGFGTLSEYFRCVGFVLPEEITGDPARWHEDGFAMPAWQLQFPLLAEVHPFRVGPFNTLVDLLKEMQRFRW